MKWSSRKPTRVDYSQIAIILLVAALVMLFVMLLTLLAPKQTSADDWVNLRTARRMATIALPLDKVTTRYSEPIKVLYMEITAFSPTVQETDSDPLTMASGQKVRVGAIASDWNLLPEGSLIIIPNYNNGLPCVCLDTGGAIKGYKLDIFLWSTDAAIQWGRRKNVPCEILRIGWGA